MTPFPAATRTFHGQRPTVARQPQLRGGERPKKNRLVVGDSPYKLRPAASQATSSAGEDQSRGGEAVFATGWRRARRRVARLVPGPDPAGWRQGLRRLGRCRRTGWGVQHSLSKSHVSRSPGNSGSGPSRLISILWFETKGLSWLFDSRTLFPTGTSLGVGKAWHAQTPGGSRSGWPESSTCFPAIAAAVKTECRRWRCPDRGGCQSAQHRPGP